MKQFFSVVMFTMLRKVNRTIEKARLGNPNGALSPTQIEATDKASALVLVK